MGNYCHRSWTDRLRILLAGVLGLQVSFAFWSPPPVQASTTDTIRVGVRPVSNAPPGAVTDLLASANPVIQGQISLSWTAPQGNAGGVPIANQTVASYTVRYATFSVASLGNNTTSWWNDPGVSSMSLSPPGYTPQSPGSLEGTTLTGLTPGVTYYFALKSTSQSGVISSIDTEAATPGAQAAAFSTILAVSPPSSFSGTALSPTSIQWNWSLVAGATAYSVYDNSNVLLQTLSSPTTFWTEIGLSTSTAYTRQIRSANASGPSSSSTFAGRATLAVVPTSLAVTGVTSASSLNARSTVSVSRRFLRRRRRH
jgi:hypothetical protein